MTQEKTKCNNPIRDAVKKLNLDSCQKIIFERVENRCIPGMADILLTCSNGKSIWIESKWSEEWPKKVTLRPEQIIWHNHRSSVNCQTFVILRTKFQFHVWNGKHAPEIANNINSQKPLSYGTSEKDVISMIKNLLEIE